MKRHRPSVPDFKFSQPRSTGEQAPLRQVGWSFDEAHPALAEGHYLRTREQNRMLEDEKWLVAMNAKFEALRKERESKKAFFGNLKVWHHRRLCFGDHRNFNSHDGIAEHCSRSSLSVI